MNDKPPTDKEKLATLQEYGDSILHLKELGLISLFADGVKLNRNVRIINKPDDTDKCQPKVN